MGARTPLIAIHKFCLGECNWGDEEMLNTCASYECPLFPYRFGTIRTAKELEADTARAKAQAIEEDKLQSEYLKRH